MSTRANEPWRKLRAGDRVKVVDAHPDSKLKGATGVIIPAPIDAESLTDLTDLNDFFWVKFDRPIPQSNNCFSLSAQLRAEQLRLI